MKPLTRASPAKINLTLRVTARRPDGFHALESLVALVDWCDEVTVTAREDGRFTLECDDPAIPGDETNLALRAACALAEAAANRHGGADAGGLGREPVGPASQPARTGTEARPTVFPDRRFAQLGVLRGVHITLAKRIPAGAGLGGGSSNAATTLRLLNDLWQLDWPPAELERIGADIGSDVPLFFHGPLCILRGRGEQVEEIERPRGTSATPRPRSGHAGGRRYWAALILPNLHCATAAVYAAWDALAARAGETAARGDTAQEQWHKSDRTAQEQWHKAGGAPGIDTRGPRASLAEILAESGSAERLMPLLFNDLEPAAFSVVPALRELAQRAAEIAGGPVQMTGSGSALFRLFDDEPAARRFAAEIAANLGVRTEVPRLHVGL